MPLVPKTAFSMVMSVCLLLYPSQHSQLYPEPAASLCCSEDFLENLRRLNLSMCYRPLFSNADELVVLFSCNYLTISQNSDISACPGLTLCSAKIMWREGGGWNTSFSFLHINETKNSGKCTFPHLHTCLVYIDNML